MKISLFRLRLVLLLLVILMKMEPLALGSSNSNGYQINYTSNRESSSNPHTQGGGNSFYQTGQNEILNHPLYQRVVSKGSTAESQKAQEQANVDRFSEQLMAPVRDPFPKGFVQMQTEPHEREPVQNTIHSYGKNIRIPNENRVPGQSRPSVWRPQQTRYNPNAPIEKAWGDIHLLPVIEAKHGVRRSADLYELGVPVEDALLTVSVLEASNESIDQNTGYFYELELQRHQVLNSEGLIQGLAGEDGDSEGVSFSTPLKTEEGYDLRTSLNWSRIAESMIREGCQGNSQVAEACEVYQNWHQDLEFAHQLADRILDSGNKTQYLNLYSHLKTTTQFLKGFTQGLAQGSLDVLTGLPRLVRDLPDLIPAIYDGIVNYDQSWNLIQAAVIDRYEYLKSANAQEWGEFIGETTVAVGLMFVGPTSVSRLRGFRQFGKAVEKGVGRSLVQATGELSTPVVKISGEVAESLIELQATASAEVQEAVVGAARIVDSAASIERFHPLKHGPLHAITEGVGTVADTFRSSTYLEIATKEPVKLYRVYATDGKELSTYWSRIKPTGPYQAVLDSALDPAWGNTATKWVEITVPSGEQFYEGIVSEVALRRFNNSTPVGQLLGGGNQVYINKRVPRAWITDGGVF